MVKHVSSVRLPPGKSAFFVQVLLALSHSQKSENSFRIIIACSHIDFSNAGDGKSGGSRPGTTREIRFFRPLIGTRDILPKVMQHGLAAAITDGDIAFATHRETKSICSAAARKICLLSPCIF